MPIWSSALVKSAAYPQWTGPVTGDVSVGQRRHALRPLGTASEKPSFFDRPRDHLVKQQHCHASFTMTCPFVRALS